MKIMPIKFQRVTLSGLLDIKLLIWCISHHSSDFSLFYLLRLNRSGQNGSSQNFLKYKIIMLNAPLFSPLFSSLLFISLIPFLSSLWRWREAVIPYTRRNFFVARERENERGKQITHSSIVCLSERDKGEKWQGQKRRRQKEREEKRRKRRR